MLDYENRIIGVMFRHYQKKKKITIQKMISYKSDAIKPYCEICDKSCKDREAVISHKTVERMHRGRVCKRECLYVDFSYKLGLEYEVSKYLSNKLDAFANELLNVIRTKNKNQLNNLQFKINAFKDQTINYIYYSDMIKIFLAIIELELKDTYHPEIINLMELIYEYLNDDYKKIFVYYLLRYYYNCRDINKYKEYLEEAKLYHSDNPQIELKIRAIDKLPYDFLDYLLKTVNIVQCEQDKFFYWENIAFAYVNLDKYEMCVEYLDKCIALAKKYQMADYYLYQCYMRKGVALYRVQDYKGTIESFSYAYSYDINVMMLNCLMFFDCFKKLGIESKVHKYLTGRFYSKINNERVNVIFKYYKDKYVHKRTDAELEVYILEHLKPFLRKGSIYEKIILDDLTEYTEKTRHYNKLHYFMSDNKKKK